MKSYVEKNYDKESLKKIDIQEYGNYYSVPFENLKEEYKEEYEDMQNENGILFLDESTANEIVENFDNVYLDYTDTDEIDEFIDNLLANYNNYLVVAYNSNWRGQTGYNIVDSKNECFYRDYDVTQNIIGSSVKGKILKIREYSHDVPTGHDTIIIGLTDTEYEKLVYSDFDSVIKFAQEKSKNLINL